MPEISVIMPAHNAEAFIGQSIESVQQQTFQDWELMIVDDGSTDETAAVVKDYVKNDPRVIYLRQSKGGAGKARNAALLRLPLERAYVAFIEAGDLWTPEKLDTQLGQLRESSADAVFCGVKSDSEAGTKNAGTGRYEAEAGVLKFIERNPIETSTVLMKRAPIEAAGNFPEAEAIAGGDAYVLWLKLLQKGAVLQGFPETMVRQRSPLAAPDQLEAVRRDVALLSGVKFATESAEAARRNRLLFLYRELFDFLIRQKNKKEIRSRIPALNVFLGNPRIGSALSNMLFLPAGMFGRFSWWLLSALIK
jgi:teichuronic acid biosynthesis glycosyltransferase TuaG